MALLYGQEYSSIQLHENMMPLASILLMTLLISGHVKKCIFTTNVFAFILENTSNYSKKDRGKVPILVVPGCTVVHLNIG
jgi:hypothetical protein